MSRRVRFQDITWIGGPPLSLQEQETPIKVKDIPQTSSGVSLAELDQLRAELEKLGAEMGYRLVGRKWERMEPSEQPLPADREKDKRGAMEYPVLPGIAMESSRRRTGSRVAASLREGQSKHAGNAKSPQAPPQSLAEYITQVNRQR